MQGRRFFIWQGKSRTIRVSLDLIEKLNRCLSDPRVQADVEQGGILYGTLRDGVPECTNFEFFRSAHRRGIAYDLGAGERAQMARVVKARMRARGERPVGYFRTHLRPGMFLDQDDFSLMLESFADPDSVALLIRPEAGGRRTAGFFYWNDGDIDRRQTQLAFPFDAGRLSPQAVSLPDPPSARRSPLVWFPLKWAAPALVVPALAAVVVLHRPAPRAAIPVASPPAIVFAPPAPERFPEPPEEPVETSTPVASAEPARQPENAPAPVYEEDREPAGQKMLPQRVAAVAAAAPKSVEIAKISPPLPPVVEAPPVKRERTVLVAVSLEPRNSSSGKGSELRRVAGHVPLFGHAFKPKDREFTPAKPERTLAPSVPGHLAQDLAHEFPVDVRVSIDRTGTVTSAEVLNGGGTTFANLAADRASATAWRPALLGDREVASEMILHYRFRAAE